MCLPLEELNLCRRNISDHEQSKAAMPLLSPHEHKFSDDRLDNSFSTAANYHTETPHILDYSKYPDLEERQRFVQTYLSSSGEQPNDNEVKQPLDEIEKYTLASHLLWGLWGIVSEHVNKIDFDYKEYAKQRS
ncbi:choline/ethanolamine kinase, putative [Medicago truncatula]|uniref:Choline/ethanolamine kinase, putative n=1 Tax=Medicago truncatula TaxID=3880 RepID=G7LIB7_MEDTR|nr:choline/ethanolamine kinase, putative [Medicago truncatula]